MRWKLLFSSLLLVFLVVMLVLPASPVLAYNYSGYHWDTNLVHYDHMAIEDYDWRSAITSAAYTWNAAPADFTMYYSPSADNTWDTTDAGAVWLGKTTWTHIGFHITGADSLFNTYYNWGTEGEAYKYDVETVALHEFGHWLNLGHVDDEDAVMYPEVDLGQIKRDLTDDDSDGIVAIYGE